MTDIEKDLENQLNALSDDMLEGAAAWVEGMRRVRADKSYMTDHERSALEVLEAVLGDKGLDVLAPRPVTVADLADDELSTMFFTMIEATGIDTGIEGKDSLIGVCLSVKRQSASGTPEVEKIDVEALVFDPCTSAWRILHVPGEQVVVRYDLEESRDNGRCAGDCADDCDEDTGGDFVEDFAEDFSWNCPESLFCAHGVVGGEIVHVVDDYPDDNGYVTVDTPDGKDSVHLTEICNLAHRMDPDFVPEFEDAVGYAGYHKEVGRVTVIDLERSVQQLVVRDGDGHCGLAKLCDIRGWEKMVDMDKFFADEE